jgi:probable HAF family extracellular repeat protein
MRAAIVDLGTLGGVSAEASAINNSGQIIGTSTTASGHRRAFLWHDGIMTHLGTLGGNESVAHAINRRGQIIGSSTNAAGERRAFFWDDGVMSDLGTLGGNFTFAAAINKHGAVVGQSTTASGEMRAFLWQNGAMTDLSPNPPSGFASASDINDRGEIVGRVGLVGVIWVPRDRDRYHDRHGRKHHHHDRVHDDNRVWPGMPR